LGAELSYSLSVAKNSQLALRVGVNQNLYDDSDLNQANIRLAATQETFFVGGSAIVEPYFKLRLDKRQRLNRQDTGLRFSRHWRLQEDTLFSVSAIAENRDYVENRALSGPYGTIKFGYQYALDERTKAGLSLSFNRSEPEASHLRYREGGILANISRNYPKFGNIGLFANITTRGYDDFFPATDIKRRDETVAIGVSYTPQKLRIYGSRPRLLCQNERNSSNIALYDYETTDCRISFERSF